MTTIAAREDVSKSYLSRGTLFASTPSQLLKFRPKLHAEIAWAVSITIGANRVSAAAAV